MWLSRRLSVLLMVVLFLVGLFAVQPAQATCGNGRLDSGEVCDNGAQNSDTAANACRTDCRDAYCDDGVVDSGEMCDEGIGANGNSPNGCRDDCTLPVCGDGIHDDGSYDTTVFNEECDDGNNNDLDGCKKDCTSCLSLTENIEVTSDTKLCGGVFNVADYGDEGVIIVKYPGVTIDCDGATLQGSGVGAGIFIKMSNDVKIRNCTITGYSAGLKAVNSQNVTVESGNNLNDNSKAIVLENSTKTPMGQLSQQVIDSPSASVHSVLAGSGTQSDEGSQATQPSTTGSKMSKHATIPQSTQVMTTKTQPMTVVKAHGKVVVIGNQTFLRMNVEIAKAYVYAGSLRLGELEGSKGLNITSYVSRAVRGELILHYYDNKGVKTIQKVQVHPDK